MGDHELLLSLFSVIMAVIGWIGAHMIKRMDTVIDKMDDIKSELHDKISNIDTRLVKIETLSNHDKGVRHGVFK